MGSRIYSDYFGIRENAFSITPDPRYLYMSERHREAFAHLLYGAVESGGFVQLTGEVGTGKTTVCRAFLDQLPEQVDVALLLNPPETPRELLLGIITELRIPLRTPEAPLKVLVDRLNAALLAGHAKGRRTVVIIDEAQNIRPEVLEQVRLLTNLETRTAKLLQLFLIGQPELREQLTRPSLRQVAQRITARYHLEPLSRAETEDYIRHRLTVAGCREGLFTTGAMKQVYQESEGIPRVINILCDRALLGAFAVDKAQVDGPMVRYAARQWRGAQRPRDGRHGLWRGAGIAAALLLLATALVYTYRDEYLDLPLLRTLLTPALAAPVHAPAAPAVAEPAAPPAADSAQTDEAAPRTLGHVLPAQPAGPASRREAEQTLLRQWRIAASYDDDTRLCDVAAGNGLRCRREIAGLGTLRAYNRPAILTLVQPDGGYSYGTLLAVDGEGARLQFGDEMIRVSSVELERYWNGEFMLLWGPPLDGTFVISAGSPPQAVQWLRHALDRAEGITSPDSGKTYFDHALQARLKAFQARRGLVTDGIAGMQTLTHLLNVSGEPRGPLLDAEPPYL
jgi:general secretion pathway protein A